MTSAFTWDDEHLSAVTTCPFVTAREAWWTGRALGLPFGHTEVSGSVDLQARVRGALLVIEIEASSPDSYSPEREEMDAHPDRWRDSVAAQLDGAARAIDESLRGAGITALAVPPAPLPDPRAERLRVDPARAMPPTRRKVRYAGTVIAADAGGYTFERGRRADAQTIFCDSATGEPTERVPLLLGETYWVTGEGPSLSTVDVAVVDAASLDALAPTRDACAALGLDTSIVDLRAFLARELQYGPLDAAASGRRLSAILFEQHEAVTTAAGSVALANSLAAILARIAPSARAAAMREASALDPEGVLESANRVLAEAGSRRRFVPASGDIGVWILR